MHGPIEQMSRDGMDYSGFAKPYDETHLPELHCEVRFAKLHAELGISRQLLQLASNLKHKAYRSNPVLLL